jgi:hypothetical protein
MGVGSGAVAPTYTGPGDIVSSATAWYGLRAYNAAYATGSNNAVNVRRASDNGTQNIVILSTGALDIATANTFAGTDATASCTIATTVATCTGASSTPHTGSTITGSGVQTPCIVTSVGSFTGGAGTVNLVGIGTSPCGTISVAVTLTFQYGLYVTEAYDQSGNGYHSLQSTAGAQPQLVPNSLGSFPAIYSNGTLTFSNVTITSTTIPLTMSVVGNRTGNTSTYTSALSMYNNSSPYQQSEFGWANSTNQANLFAGSHLQVTASDNAWHAIQGVANGNGTSSSLNVDGTDTTGASGTGQASTLISLFNNPAGSAIPKAFLTETGMWEIAFTLTQRGNICHNQYTYWSTPTSC